MKYVEAPSVELEPTDYKIFLAGGVTWCADWQAVLLKRLQDLPDNIVILNPRRSKWPIDDSTASEAQIDKEAEPAASRGALAHAECHWEFRMLREANLIVFWFPCQTVCPIELYELGYWNARWTPKIIGIHPMYYRKADVELQTKLAADERHEVTPVVYSLAALEQEIRVWWNRVLEVEG